MPSTHCSTTASRPGDNPAVESLNPAVESVKVLAQIFFIRERAPPQPQQQEDGKACRQQLEREDAVLRVVLDRANDERDRTRERERGRQRIAPRAIRARRARLA